MLKKVPYKGEESLKKFLKDQLHLSCLVNENKVLKKAITSNQPQFSLK